MSTGHAKLGPSSAHRWIACPGSVRLSEQVHDIPSTSVYATEGTDAHTLAEIRACERFGLCAPQITAKRVAEWERDVPDPEVREDMEKYAAAYCDFLEERMALHKEPSLFLEQRYDTGIPEVWGTADAAIVSAYHIEIVDFKYGEGVLVRAVKNPQLMLYTLGALHAFDVIGTAEHVSMSIFQPRIDNIDTFSMTAEDLYLWRDNVAGPAARLALSNNAPLNPSDSACRFCPAAGTCRARTANIAEIDFREPDLLTVEEMSYHLSRVKEIRDWCTALEIQSLDLAYAGKIDIPGWKVVRTNGRRSIPDDAAAIAALKKAGFPETRVARTTVQTLGTLEKVVGAAKLTALLGELIVKSDGKPSLAPETDPRDAITMSGDARDDFGPHGLGPQHDT